MRVQFAHATCNLIQLYCNAHCTLSEDMQHMQWQLFYTYLRATLVDKAAPLKAVGAKALAPAMHDATTAAVAFMVLEEEEVLALTRK
jgi:hypothetical protein